MASWTVDYMTSRSSRSDRHSVLVTNPVFLLCHSSYRPGTAESCVYLLCRKMVNKVCVNHLCVGLRMQQGETQIVREIGEKGKHQLLGKSGVSGVAT